MSKHPDWENDNFDDFIRRSVEGPDIPFDPKAWQAMEQKLDAAAGGDNSAGKGGFPGKRIAGLVVAIFLLSGLSWFIFSGESISAGNKNLNESSGGLSQEQAAEENNLPEKLNNTGDGEEVSFVKEKTRQPSLAPDNSLTKQEEQTVRKSISSEQQQEQQEQQKNKASDRTKETAIGSLNSEEPLPLNVVQRSKTEAVEENALVGAKAAPSANDQKLIQKRSWIPFSGEQPDLPAIATFRQKKKEREEAVALPRKTRERPLSVSFSLAPDFSGTPQAGSRKMGAGMGLHLEYRIWQGFSVVSGVFYSQKNYLADNSLSLYGDYGGYQPPEPEYIDASCGVVEIPLNLRFYALDGYRHKLFLSAGLSSYFMRSEDYTLVYNSGYYKDYTYEVRNENRHLFAIYNISAGYQRRLTGRWALELEPFLKIPAQGVGIGSVKLNSMGAFVHLKYNIGK